MTFRSFRRPAAHSQATAVEGTLRKARWMLQTGRFAPAGMLMAQQAREAEALGRARLAAELHSRAAFCLIEGKSEPAGLREALAALRVLSNLADLERFTLFYLKAIAKLRAHGMLNAVGGLQTEFGDPELLHPVPAQPHTLRLPNICSLCSATMLETEVEWIDAQSAACAYCGALVQTKDL